MPKSAGDEAFRRALFRAKAAWEERHAPRTLTYVQIGRDVARLIGRDKPISKQGVYAWFKGKVPNLTIGLALARVLEADPYDLGMSGQQGGIEMREDTGTKGYGTEPGEAEEGGKNAG